MDHAVKDRISLELAQRVAAGLPDHREWLRMARENLERWTRRNPDAPALLKCYEEWRVLLNQPVQEICAQLTAETPRGHRLRQNSPFAGALAPHEVWAVKRRHHEATTA